MRDVSVIIPAAGVGKRLRPHRSSPFGKAFIPVAGNPMVFHTLDAFRGIPGLLELILVVAPQHIERIRKKWGCQLTKLGVTHIVAGGETRQASVQRGIEASSEKASFILVHDAVRPLVRPKLIRQILREVRRKGAVIAAVPATDTVKRVGSQMVVEATLERKRIWLSQTPQAFLRDLLLRAHERSCIEKYVGTDDAELVERLGYRIGIVKADADNLKVTTLADLRIVEWMIKVNSMRCSGPE